MPMCTQVRAPQPAVHVFLIDVSAPSIESGLLHTTIETIKRHVMALPGDDRKMVGFITYDSALHFYKLKVSILIFFPFSSISDGGFPPYLNTAFEGLLRRCTQRLTMYSPISLSG
jgi:hypothetical protein